MTSWNNRQRHITKGRSACDRFRDRRVEFPLFPANGRQSRLHVQPMITSFITGISSFRQNRSESSPRWFYPPKHQSTSSSLPPSLHARCKFVGWGDPEPSDWPLITQPLLHPSSPLLFRPTSVALLGIRLPLRKREPKCNRGRPRNGWEREGRM